MQLPKFQFRIVVLDGEKEGKQYIEVNEKAEGAKESLHKKIKFRHCYIEQMSVVKGEK